MQGMKVRSLGREDRLEMEQQFTPVFLPGKFHGQEPDRQASYSSWGCRVRQYWVTEHAHVVITHLILTRALRGRYSIVVMLHNKPCQIPMPYSSKCWFLLLPPAFGVWLISAGLCQVWLLHVSLILLDLMLGIWIETIAFLHWHRAFSSYLFSFLTFKKERAHGKKKIIHTREETSLEASQWLRLISQCRGPRFDPWSGN